MSPLSRRSFLAAGASAAVLAACGDGKKTASSSTASSSASGSTSAPGGDLVIVSFSDTSALVPGRPQRIPFGFADKEGVIVDQPPAPLVDFEVTLNDQTVATLKAAPHQTDLPRPYYPIVFTPPQPGTYSVTATVNGARLETAVQIPATTTVVGPGQKMIPVDTPTTGDPKGQLVCTREPPCPLHDVTLRAALAAGTPVAFLVATPKFCQTAICGPVLDVLVKQKDQFPLIKMLHAEVYPTEAAAQPGVQQVTEAVTAYGLTFEPVLYLAKADGTIATRVDTIFDGVELHDALAQLVS